MCSVGCYISGPEGDATSQQQAAEQQAISELLGSPTGVCLGWDLADVFSQEADAVARGDTAGLWLLPALAHISTLLVGRTLALPRHVQLWPSGFGSDDVARAPLATVLAHGYLPRLRHLVLNVIDSEGKLIDHGDEKEGGFLPHMAQVLKARPGLEISFAHKLRSSTVDRLRARLARIPAPDAGSGSSSSSASTLAGGTMARIGVVAWGGPLDGLTLDDEGRRLLCEGLLC